MKTLNDAFEHTLEDIYWAENALSKALQKAGFKFVGSTICYAFMQAVGMIDDHVTGCWRVE